MKGDTANYVMNFIKFPCPFCKEEYMTKANFRVHLKRKHDELEAEIYIKKCLQRQNE